MNINEYIVLDEALAYINDEEHDTFNEEFTFVEVPVDDNHPKFECKLKKKIECIKLQNKFISNPSTLGNEDITVFKFKNPIVSDKTINNIIENNKSKFDNIDDRDIKLNSKLKQFSGSEIHLI